MEVIGKFPCRWISRPNSNCSWLEDYKTGFKSILDLAIDQKIAIEVLRFSRQNRDKISPDFLTISYCKFNFIGSLGSKNVYEWYSVAGNMFICLFVLLEAFIEGRLGVPKRLSLTSLKLALIKPLYQAYFWRICSMGLNKQSLFP